MESQSQMVWAKKWQLKTPLSLKAGTYDPNGTKEMKHDWKLVPRDWVEYRNSQPNNELYEVDEEETDRLMELREENIKLQEEKKKKESVSNADLVGAIAHMASKHVEAETPQVNEELEDARARYKELFGKKPHHATKLDTINAKIAEKEAESED